MKNLYLDLLKNVLLDTIYPDPSRDIAKRDEGRDVPKRAYTMIGRKRLENIQTCLETIWSENIPGDLLEAGVLRGGACIFMRGFCQYYGEPRRVFVCDSFQGLPQPDPAYPLDKAIGHLATTRWLKVSQAQVEANFKAFGLLDERVVFVPGWFKDSLPPLTEELHQLALLRIDGDYYQSTWEALTYLYPKLAPGGFCLVDDYNDIEACRQAVDDYRAQNNITAPIQAVDWTGIYWRKPKLELHSP